MSLGLLTTNGRANRRRVAVAFSVSILAACAAGATKPTSAALRFTSEIEGNDAATDVLVFLLRSPDAFQAADHIVLARDPEGSLGNSLVEMRRLRLASGQSADVETSAQGDVQYAGVFGVFDGVQGAVSMLLIPLDSGRTNKAVITVSKAGLAIK